MVTEEEVIDILKTVKDPELDLNIYDLGLIYKINVEGPKVHILMTLTSMGCALGPTISNDVEMSVKTLKEVEEVDVELTFDPAWSQDMLSEAAKELLGF